MGSIRFVLVAALLVVSACAAPPPPEPTRVRTVAPPPEPVRPVYTPPVSTGPLAAPVVETVSDGELIDLTDDSDIIGLDERTARPVSPTPRPDCVPTLEATVDPDCTVPEADAAEGDLDVDLGIDPVVEPELTLDASDT